MQEDTIMLFAIKCSLQSCSNEKYYTQILEYRDHLRTEKNQWSRQYTKQQFLTTKNLCSHNVYSRQKEEERVKGKRESLLAQMIMTESSLYSLVISDSVA